jgi:Transmembrane amino acid transporter protein
MVGVAVLALPAGISANGSSSVSSSIPVAVLLILGMGMASAISFSWIAHICDTTNSNSYLEAWSKTMVSSSAKYDSSSSWIVAASVTAMAFVAVLALSMVLADTVSALTNNTCSRTAVLWTLTMTVLAPLCWIKTTKTTTRNGNLLETSSSSLAAPFSILGVMGMVYAALAMTFRYWRGSYLGGSPFLNQVPLQLRPSFSTATNADVGEGWQSAATMLSILFSAYTCHYLAPTFCLTANKDNTATATSTTIPNQHRRFNTVVATVSFGIATALTVMISVVGFATFGTTCSSNGILNNYARQGDVCMSLARFAVVIALLASYPLHFSALRNGVMDLINIRIPKTTTSPERSNADSNTTTLALVFVLTVLATKIQDVSFILAFGGATLGNLLCIVYPAIMFARGSPARKIPATALAVTGVVFGIIGANVALQKAM